MSKVKTGSSIYLAHSHASQMCGHSWHRCVCCTLGGCQQGWRDRPSLCLCPRSNLPARQLLAALQQSMRKTWTENAWSCLFSAWKSAYYKHDPSRDHTRAAPLCNKSGTEAQARRGQMMRHIDLHNRTYQVHSEHSLSRHYCNWTEVSTWCRGWASD